MPGAPQAGKAARNAAGDDYLPPNKILFVQELPETVTRDALESLFKQYSGFQEVRTVPAKKSIAFVEYDSEAASTAARDALFNAELDGVKIKVRRFANCAAHVRSALMCGSAPVFSCRLRLPRKHECVLAENCVVKVQLRNPVSIEPHLTAHPLGPFVARLSARLPTRKRFLDLSHRSACSYL